jgi:hypothetical protein
VRPFGGNGDLESQRPSSGAPLSFFAVRAVFNGPTTEDRRPTRQAAEAIAKGLAVL